MKGVTEEEFPDLLGAKPAQPSPPKSHSPVKQEEEAKAKPGPDLESQIKKNEELVIRKKHNPNKPHRNKNNKKGKKGLKSNEEFPALG